jgi:glycosyltransferase involved in cell wall biosynthesis
LQSQPVVFWLENLETGGVQRVVSILARYFVEEGLRTQILTCSNSGALKTTLPPEVEVIELPRGNPLIARLVVARACLNRFPGVFRYVLMIRDRSKTLAYLPGLISQLRDNPPAAFFAATPYMNMEAVIARSLSGRSFRLVISERSHFSSGKPRKKRRVRRLCLAMKSTYSEADAIVAVSEGVADDLSAAIGIPRDRITTVHNPTITPDFAERVAESVDDAWFSDPQVPVLLAVGRLSGQKDYDTLLRAFAIASKERELRLAIIGDQASKGPKSSRAGRLQRLARELKIDENFRFLGVQSNPVRFMARSSLLVLSSRWEGLPNVLLEALACGTPVVSTNCPSGPHEILAGGTYGRLVPVGDPKSLAAAILQTLQSPPDPNCLKRRAAEFSYEGSTGRYREVILGLAGSGPMFAGQT